MVERSRGPGSRRSADGRAHDRRAHRGCRSGGPRGDRRRGPYADRALARAIAVESTEVGLPDGPDPRQVTRCPRIPTRLISRRCSRYAATRVSSSSSSEVPRRCFKVSPSRPRTSTSSTGGRRRTWHVSSRCQGYDELLAHSESLVDEGRQLRVLDLPTLIRVKTKAGRPKDRVMLPVLIATLQEREKLGK